MIFQVQFLCIRYMRVVMDTENVKSPAHIYVVWGHSTWLPLMLFLMLDRGDIKWNPVFIQPQDQIFARPSARRVVISPLEDIHCEQVIAHFSRSHRAPATRAWNEGCRRLREVSQSQRRPLLGPSPGWKRLLVLSHLRHYAKQTLTPQ